MNLKTTQPSAPSLPPAGQSNLPAHPSPGWLAAMSRVLLKRLEPPRVFYENRIVNIIGIGTFDYKTIWVDTYVTAETRKRFGVDLQNVKFDIVAHSMGGLVTRYYLRCGTQDLPEDGSLPALTWEGARHIEHCETQRLPNDRERPDWLKPQRIHGKGTHL